jgi:hypothetical protein
VATVEGIHEGQPVLTPLFRFRQGLGRCWGHRAADRHQGFGGARELDPPGRPRRGVRFRRHPTPPTRPPRAGRTLPPEGCSVSAALISYPFKRLIVFLAGNRPRHGRRRADGAHEETEIRRTNRPGAAQRSRRVWSEC